ncbi:MAG: hypothetical protein J6I55_05400 [Ruminococcus sp.]|nr:hypothetical protein [Ruminococcus sp.]
MACFIVPAAEAAVTTIVKKVIDKKADGKNIFAEKLGRLNGMLWGGSGLLAFEHLWHGEIKPFFPFLTAAENPADLVQMFHEMSISGTSMAVLVTGVWAATVIAENCIVKKTVREARE